MKFSILCILISLFSHTKTFCQDNSSKNTKVYLGFSAGRAETSFEGSEIDVRLKSPYQNSYLEPRKGLVLTLQSKVTFGKYIFIRPSITYIEKGAEEMDATFFYYNFKADLNYLSIPLLVGIQPINFDNVRHVNIYFEGGIVPNFQLSRKNDNLTKGYAEDPILHEMVWSYQVGAGIEVKIFDKIVLFGNYSYFKDISPFFEVYTHSTVYAFNRGTAISVGMMINMKKKVIN